MPHIVASEQYAGTGVTAAMSMEFDNPVTYETEQKQPTSLSKLRPQGKGNKRNKGGSAAATKKKESNLFDVDGPSASVDLFTSYDPAAGMVSVEDAVSVFRECDRDGVGYLVREGVGKLLQRLGREQHDEETVDTMLTEVWEADGQVGNIGQLPLEGFVSWWAVHAADELGNSESEEEEEQGLAGLASNPLVKPFVSIAQSVGGVLKKGADAAEKSAGLQQSAKVRGIPPESIFVLDQSGNADGAPTF
eukprot:COSAG01_NODE_1158_length_11469_cov_101.645646_2_plen_248_part_00